MVKRSVIDFNKKVEVLKFLEQVCVRLEGGFCEYKEPWDDTAVAKRYTCAPSNVAGIRKAQFGRLEEGPGAYITRIEKLEKEFSELQDFAMKRLGYKLPTSNGH